MKHFAAASSLDSYDNPLDQVRIRPCSFDHVTGVFRHFSL